MMAGHDVALYSCYQTQCYVYTTVVKLHKLQKCSFAHEI